MYVLFGFGWLVGFFGVCWFIGSVASAGGWWCWLISDLSVVMLWLVAMIWFWVGAGLGGFGPCWVLLVAWWFGGFG